MSEEGSDSLDPKAEARMRAALDPKTKTGRLRRWAYLAITRHRAAGTIPTSTRHLYYEAVMDASCVDVGKGHTGSRRPDQDLSEALTWLRENRFVRWEEIEDRTRHLIPNTSWETLAEGLDAQLDLIRLDPYMYDTLPILVVESESVAGVLTGLAARYRVPIIPTRGQSAGFLRTKVPALLGVRQVAVGYVGDADKAGGDIEANTEKVLSDVLDVVSWERLALTWEQVTAHGLPTERRYDKRTRRTSTACEVEALPQAILVQTVDAFLADLLPESLQDVLDREEDERTALRDLLAH